MKNVLQIALAAALASSSIVSSVTPTVANTDFAKVPTITKTVNIAGKPTTFFIDPAFALNGGSGYVGLNLKADINAQELQSTLPAQINGRKKYDECGTRFTLSHAGISPVGNGKALVGVTAQAQQWQCVKTKLPKTHCKKSKIKLPFGGWTYGPPKCSVKWKMETMKTKLISQSARIEALVWPIIQNGHAKANVQVTKAAPSGLLGDLVNGLGLNGLIKSAVQKEVTKAVNEKGQVKLPDEFQQYNVKVNQADFIDIGGGKLGLRINAEGKATQSQIAQLIAENLAQ